MAGGDAMTAPRFRLIFAAWLAAGGSPNASAADVVAWWCG